MLKKYLIAISVMLVSVGLTAQTDVRIMDLSMLPFPDITKPKSDSLTLTVMFKINNPANASKIQFLMGAAPYQSDVFAASPIIYTTDHVSHINYNNVSTVINGYSAAFKIKLSKQQYNSFKIATLYVEKKDGQQTSPLFKTK